MRFSIPGSLLCTYFVEIFDDLVVGHKEEMEKRFKLKPPFEQRLRSIGLVSRAQVCGIK